MIILIIIAVLDLDLFDTQLAYYATHHDDIGDALHHLHEVDAALALVVEQERADTPTRRARVQELAPHVQVHDLASGTGVHPRALYG
jgi:hypothetical protein